MKVFYKTIDGVPMDNFCSDAAIGAKEHGIEKIYPFENIEDVPYSKESIVITSVEESIKWLGYKVTPIDDSWSNDFKKRIIEYKTIDEIDESEYPCFIKPAEDIKAFTGLVVNNVKEAKLFTQSYSNKVEVQKPIYDIESEYRVYIHRDRGILGVKHYLGNPFLTLNEEFVNEVHNMAKKSLKENSYSLDFGIRENGENFLIEINDGWSIGNYGLSPYDYYSFVKTRWLQLLNVIK